LGSEGTRLYPTTYEELRPFVLMRGMELLGQVKTKIITSRVRGTYKDIEDSIYILK